MLLHKTVNCEYNIQNLFTEYFVFITEKNVWTIERWICKPVRFFYIILLFIWITRTRLLFCQRSLPVWSMPVIYKRHLGNKCHMLEGLCSVGVSLRLPPMTGSVSILITHSGRGWGCWLHISGRGWGYWLHISGRGWGGVGLGFAFAPKNPKQNTKWE